jgi:hypothetical protein
LPSTPTTTSTSPSSPEQPTFSTRAISLALAESLASSEQVARRSQKAGPFLATRDNYSRSRNKREGEMGEEYQASGIFLLLGRCC